MQIKLGLWLGVISAMIFIVIPIMACATAAAPLDTPEPTPSPLPTPTFTPEPTERAYPTPDIGATIDAKVAALLAAKNDAVSPNIPPASTEILQAQEQTQQDNEPQPTNTPMISVPTPEPTHTPTPLPTATPIPTPTLVYRPESQSQDLIGMDGFKFTAGPTALGDTIKFSARIETGAYIEPTQIQVFQVLNKDVTPECTTEKPIAFVSKPNGSGSAYLPTTSNRTWLYCLQKGQKPVQYSADIPWLAALQWDIGKNNRPLIWSPYITTWVVSISLADERVDDLRYAHPAGWVIVGFAGDTLLFRQWIDY